MAKIYKIRAGFSFSMGDGKVKTDGESIELDDDTAANHAHKLEEVVPEAKKAQSSASKSDKKAAPVSAPASIDAVTTTATAPVDTLALEDVPATVEASPTTEPI